MRVAIIGLDGVPFDLVASLAQEGHLPNLRRVLEEGVSGVLWSTVPSISPVAWTSMATGLNPGKHGVFGFVDRRFRPHSSRDLRGKAIWDLASSAGKTVICLNVPFTYPPYRVRGAMVSGPPCPKDEPSTYPPGLKDELEELGYRIDVRLPYGGYRGVREAEFFKDCLSVTEARAEAVLRLAEEFKWDLLFVVFTTLDRVQHVFFGRAIRESPFYDRRGREALIDYYRALDSILGKLLSELGDDTVFFFVSDHGFELLRRFVGLDNLISDFLARKEPKRLLYNLAVRAARRLRMTGIIKKALSKSGLPSSTHGEAGRSGIQPGLGSIYFDGPEQELRELIGFLMAVRDEEGTRVFERFYLKDELYWGPELHKAPDLVLVPRAGYEIKSRLTDRFEDVRPAKGVIYKTGTHMSLRALDGFLAIYGPGVREGHRVDACLYDIAPTVLHVLGLPVLKDMDGEVLIGAFEENSEPARRPVREARLRIGRPARRPRRAGGRRSKNLSTSSPEMSRARLPINQIREWVHEIKSDSGTPGTSILRGVLMSLPTMNAAMM